MQIRLTRKLANVLDGVDVSTAHVGDILELPRREADLLIVEGWAVQHTPQAGRRAPGGRIFRTSRRQHIAADIQLYEAADSEPREVRSVEQLREVREQMEQRHLDQKQRRRVEDRIREELHDETARTVQ